MRTVPVDMDATIEKGTTVQTDSYRSYIKPLRKGYNHESADFDPNSEHLKWLHTIIGNAKAFLKGTYHIKAFISAPEAGRQTAASKAVSSSH